MIIHHIRLSCRVRRGLRPVISYDNLWNVMKEKGITQYMLIKRYNISPGQITRLKRNESVSTHTIEMFCRILSCEVGDIMKFIPDELEQRNLLFFSWEAHPHFLHQKHLQNSKKQEAHLARFSSSRTCFLLFMFALSGNQNIFSFKSQGFSLTSSALPQRRQPRRR